MPSLFFASPPLPCIIVNKVKQGRPGMRLMWTHIPDSLHYQLRIHWGSKQGIFANQFHFYLVDIMVVWYVGHLFGTRCCNVAFMVYRTRPILLLTGNWCRGLPVSGPAPNCFSIWTKRCSFLPLRCFLIVCLRVMMMAPNPYSTIFSIQLITPAILAYHHSSASIHHLLGTTNIGVYLHWLFCVFIFLLL